MELPSFSGKPVFGLSLDSAELVRRGPVGLVFFRHAGSAWSRYHASRLNEAVPALEESGARIVGVIEGEQVAVRDFVPRLHLLFPVLHDASLYERWGVGHDRGLRRTIARPWTFRHAVRQLSAGHGALDRRLTRLPAAFAIVGGEIAWSWQASTIFAPLPVGRLTQALVSSDMLQPEE